MKSSESVKERILEAAIKVFSEKGFHETKVDEIADIVEIAKGTIYLYFKDKEEILLEAIEFTFDKIIKFYTVDENLSFEQNLRNIFSFNYEHLKSNKKFYNLIFTQMYNLRKDIRDYESKMKMMFKMHKEIISKLENLVEIGIKEKRIRSNISQRNLALFLNYLIEGVLRAIGMAMLGNSISFKTFEGTHEEFIENAINSILNLISDVGGGIG